ncbi:MAG TPA: ABC-type transport auxiliary lipoprotein family protein, partial [Oxalicibacterium sp.]|nr:ABC-type transport auxiliary lipoprotein family protein [Oxalicibacterium sp.]
MITALQTFLTRRRTVAALAAGTLLAGLLSGCAGTPPADMDLYDLGPLKTGTASSSLPAISIADIRAPAWMDSQMMFYRLNYANDLQPRPYSASKWTMPPAQLFEQRLKASLARAGGVVVSASDGAINLPVLHLEADDFSQTFASASSSTVHVAIRASLFDGRVLRAQKNFVKQVPAASADAKGGAAALAAASDAIISEVGA